MGQGTSHLSKIHNHLWVGTYHDNRVNIMYHRDECITTAMSSVD